MQTVKCSTAGRKGPERQGCAGRAGDGCVAGAMSGSLARARAVTATARALVDVEQGRAEEFVMKCMRRRRLYKCSRRQQGPLPRRSDLARVVDGVMHSFADASKVKSLVLHVGALRSDARQVQLHCGLLGSIAAGADYTPDHADEESEEGEEGVVPRALVLQQFPWDTQPLLEAFADGLLDEASLAAEMRLRGAVRHRPASCPGAPLMQRAQAVNMDTAAPILATAL